MADKTELNVDEDWVDVGTIQGQQAPEQLLIDDKVQFEAVIAEQATIINFWKNRALVFQQKLVNFQKKLQERQEAGKGKVN